MKKLIFLLSLSLFLLTNCDNWQNVNKKNVQTPPTNLNEQKTQAAIDKEKIEKYLEDLFLLDKAQTTSSGIHYIIEIEGNGMSPSEESTVKITFQTSLLDGTTFEDSKDFQKDGIVTFGINEQFIKGWKEAIMLLKEGGKGTFIIPSGLAYGKRSSNKFPANAVLIYNIELIEVN
ncbi:MAG: FKBP-type peptidyl-prolyl cis-trans isomerase [Chitinophagales bacterium]